MAFVAPTPEELSQVEEIRALIVANEIKCTITDVGLLRYLRGRRSVENAYQSIVRHAEWRDQHKVDDWRDYNVEIEKAKNKAYRHAQDKDGMLCRDHISDK
jgi:hypothetical protein